MTALNNQNEYFENNVLLYANAFLNGYNDAINKFYSVPINEIEKLGFSVPGMALRKKKLEDVSLKVFVSDYDFFLFFVKPTGKQVEFFNNFTNSQYNREWTFRTPSDIRLTDVKNVVGISEGDLLLHVNVPGINGYLLEQTHLNNDGLSHGNSHGVIVGNLANELLPIYKNQDAQTRQRSALSQRYRQLVSLYEKKNKTRKETLFIGHSFEVLWRDLLNHWSWQARKIEIDGERNDFTAMYNGNHILGECRWVDKAQDADKVRAFGAKLNPRARSIGLMVAYNGFNKNAIKEARRLVQSGNPLVFFSKAHLDDIFLKFIDPTDIMNKELRDVLDFLYEK